MDQEEKDLLESSLENAYSGMEDNAFGSKERTAAATEFAEFYKIHVERFKAYDNSELEREKLEAEKKKVDTEAELEREKIKAEDKKDRRNAGVKLVTLVGVTVVSGLMLIVDSDNWVGRGCRKGADFVSRMLRL